MMGRIRFVTILGLAALWGPRAAAQTDPCLHRTVPVTVLDAAGQPITNLAASDFQGKFRGKPVKILSAVADDRPHRIVILLDASGSMAGDQGEGRGWRQALALASHLAEARLAKTQVALLIFAEKVNEQIGFTQGQAAVAERLQRIRSDATFAKKSIHGKTAMFDALLAGLNLLGTPNSSDIVYLLSDGGENSSRARESDVHHLLAASGVRVFSSLVFSDPGYRNRTPEELNGPSIVKSLAEATGGQVIFPFFTWPSRTQKDSEELSKGMVQFYGSMIQDSLLEVELPMPVDKWRNWDLEVANEKKPQWKNAQIIYPHEVSPCSASVSSIGHTND